MSERQVESKVLMGKKWKTKRTILSCSVNTCCGHAWKATCGLGVSPSSQEEYSGPGRGFTEELRKDMKWLSGEPQSDLVKTLVLGTQMTWGDSIVPYKIMNHLEVVDGD